MIPFAEFGYVVPVALACLLAIALNLVWRPSAVTVLLLSAMMALAVFRDTASGWRPCIALLAFVGYQWCLARALLVLRRRADHSRPSPVAHALSETPPASRAERSGAPPARVAASLPPAVYALAIVLALSPLVLVKLEPFYGWASAMTGLSLRPSVVNYTAFLGLSYVTFKSVQVLIEIKDGLVTRVGLIDYLAFCLFFPTIAAGPIDRYRRFLGDLNESSSRRDLLALIPHGLDHIIRGMFYKFVVAYLINAYWLEPLSASTSGQAQGLAVGLERFLSQMYACSFYLFFDFAGYSSLAIGCSYLLGIRTPPNFNRPFLSRTIREFWNRWHMTLSFWLRDFLYMRLMLWLRKGSRIRNRYAASYLAFMVTFGAMGAWHGFQGHYLLYGLYHGVLMILYDLVGRTWARRRGNRAAPTSTNSTQPWSGPGNRPRGTLATAAQVAVTVQLVCFGFWIFSGMPM